ncbi:MAG: hypothetical protein ACTHXC_00485 [Brachybacterium sp.]
MNEVITQWGGWAFGLLSIVLSGLFSIFGKKTSLEHQMIDQLQEQVDNQGAQLKLLDGKLDSLRRETRLRDDYISELRRQINQEEGPPPRKWPEGLR